MNLAIIDEALLIANDYICRDNLYYKPVLVLKAVEPESNLYKRSIDVVNRQTNEVVSFDDFIAAPTTDIFSLNCIYNDCISLKKEIKEDESLTLDQIAIVLEEFKNLQKKQVVGFIYRAV